jgi:hypothetical protein
MVTMAPWLEGKLIPESQNSTDLMLPPPRPLSVRLDLQRQASDARSDQPLIMTFSSLWKETASAPELLPAVGQT